MTVSVYTCRTCGRTLPLSEFPKHKGYGKLGIVPHCKRDWNAKKRANARAGTPFVPGPYDPSGYAKWVKAKGLQGEPAVAQFEAFFEEFSGLEFPEHAHAWTEAALSNTYLLLNVPPGHAKTTIMSMWFPLWLLARDRDKRIIVVSETANGSVKRIARVIAHNLEYNEPLIKTFGRFRPESSTAKWSESQGELAIEGKSSPGDLSIQVRGAGQQILGMRADWIIVDDITNRRVAVSDIKRNEEWDYFHGDVMTRLEPGGQVFCIGQRVHSDDLYGNLARVRGEDGVPVWHVERTPAILDEESKKVLWPERFPYEWLKAKRTSIGTALFNCMYQQAPEVSGDFVPRWWIFGSEENKGCLDRNRLLGQGYEPEVVFGDGRDWYVPITRVISVDPSPTQYAGIVVADIVFQHRATEFFAAVVDVARDKMGQRKMIETVEALTYQHRPSILILEENSAKWLKEDISWNRVTNLYSSTIYHKTGVNKNGEWGVWSLASDFEAGRIRFPYGDEEARAQSNYLIDEVLAYPNGSTDDTVMALWFIKFNYRKLLPRDFLPTSFETPVPGTGRAASWNMSRLQQVGSWRQYSG